MKNIKMFLMGTLLVANVAQLGAWLPAMEKATVGLVTVGKLLAQRPKIVFMTLGAAEIFRLGMRANNVLRDKRQERDVAQEKGRLTRLILENKKPVDSQMCTALLRALNVPEKLDVRYLANLSEHNALECELILNVAQQTEMCTSKQVAELRAQMARKKK